MVNAFEDAHKIAANQFRELVPFYGSNIHGLWIDSSRYCNISPVCLEYLKNTKGKHNLCLLKDSAISIYRFSLDRHEDKDESKKDFLFEYAHLNGWSFKPEDWKHIDRWRYFDALVMTTWYLKYGCGSSNSLVSEILGSLGVHKYFRKSFIDSAEFRKPKFLDN